MFISNIIFFRENISTNRRATITLKILLVEFPDVRHRTSPFAYTKTHFEELLVSHGNYVSPVKYNPDGVSVYGSMRDYFEKMSSGNLTIEGYVLNQGADLPVWLELPYSKSYYNGLTSSSDQIFTDAIDVANNAGLDTSTSSNVKLAIIYAGSTMSSYIVNNFIYGSLNPKQSGDKYIMGERLGWPLPTIQENINDKFSRIGIHVHEFAHTIGIGHASGSRADVMQSSRNGDYAAPAPLNPLHRSQKGWLSPIIIIGQQEWNVYYSITSPQVFRINSSSNNDYFIVENRRFNQNMIIGTTLVPDYNNSAFFPPAWPHGTISQGIFVWRSVNGYLFDYSNNGLIYASGNLGATCPEGIPSQTDDGVPFPGHCNVRVLSPWSDSRNPWCPPNSCVFVPNTRYSSNVGMEILEVNDFQGYIRVKLYANNPEDAPPSKPRNLTVTLNPQSYPIVNWDANTEPDMPGGQYKIWRAFTTTSEPITFHQAGSINISGGGAKPPSTYSWLDYDVCGAGSGGGRIYYTVSAVDNTNLESVRANHDWIPWQMVFCKDKPGYEAIAISEYKLYSNFPNPFNPLTTIQYDIKEAGLVHIKVYDILGTEMTELVNEFKEKGKHFITFDASNLPSGVYIYSIRANDFIANYKMTILK